MNNPIKAGERRTQKQTQVDNKLDGGNAAVPFTARLMAYYRAQERKRETPLIVDPFAERLAGDLTAYLEKHKRYSEMDYSLVRAYYIENKLLTPWCHIHKQSQIVLLGAGLDTRAYRFSPLKTHSHTIFEIDFPVINRYKDEILTGEPPLCKLVRISADLTKPEWTNLLETSGFSNDIPTFWVLKGLVYYMEQQEAASLLVKTTQISAELSQIFVDVCIPVFVEVKVGPFSRHFKWGLDFKAISSFFATTGWQVSCSFADDHDQGRDVGQKGLMFVQGMRM